MARAPKPSQLVGTRPAKPPTQPAPITFRLTPDDDKHLRAMAKQAGAGPSTLARRIVEHYIREQLPRGKKGER